MDKSNKHPAKPHITAETTFVQFVILAKFAYHVPTPKSARARVGTHQGDRKCRNR